MDPRRQQQGGGAESPPPGPGPGPGPASLFARSISAESDAHSSLGQHSASATSSGANASSAAGGAGGDERSSSQGSHGGSHNPNNPHVSSPTATPRQAAAVGGVGSVPPFPGSAGKGGATGVTLPPPWPSVVHPPQHSPVHQGTPASASTNYVSTGTVGSSGSNSGGMGGQHPHMPPPPPQLMSGAGLFPPPQQAGSQLSLSMTKSGESGVFSGGSVGSTPREGQVQQSQAQQQAGMCAGTMTPGRGGPQRQPPNAPGSARSAAQQQQQQHNPPANTPAKTVASAASMATEAEKSVLLGLEELERQQASLEERRATEELRRRFDVEARKMEGRGGGGGAGEGAGLPPLPPRPASAPGSGAYGPGGHLGHHPGQHHPQGGPHGAHGGHPQHPPGPHGHHQPGRLPPSEVSHSPVPDHIHLTENDEDTILTSDQIGDRALEGEPGDGGAEGGDESMRRVKSIDRLRDTVSGSLRRFRSWSLHDALGTKSENPAPSVDSTQDPTLSTIAGPPGGADGSKLSQSESARTRTRSRTSSASPRSGSPLTPVLSNRKRSLPSARPSGGSDVDYLEGDIAGVAGGGSLIFGYLHKLGRNGHWQRRFFESDGSSLTYYKSGKRNKVLATLDLCKVGEIAIDQTDPERCTFTIQVLNRPYYLLAEDRAKCVDWVIQLNRAREARMNVGNIALADKPAAGGGGGGATSPAASHHRSQAGSDEYQPTIVYNTLRPRTRAVVYDGADGSNGEGGGVPDLLRPAGSVEEQIEVLPGWSEHHRHSPASDAVARHPSPSSAADASMAKWQKRHSRMHLLSLRFLRWARSITNQADACRREQGVVVVPAHVARAYLAAAAGGSAETFEGADPGGGW